jgi:hypothetical protein
MLYLGFMESPLSLVSSLSIHTDLRKEWIAGIMAAQSFSGMSLMMSAVPLVRSLFNHAFSTMSCTLSLAYSVKPLMVNTKFRHGGSRGVMRKVMARDDQTLQAMRMSCLASVRFYIRKAVGVDLVLFASLLGMGAAMPTSHDCIISAVAAKCFAQMVLCFSREWASFLNGMASSLCPLYWTHSSRQSRSILLKMAVG